MQKSAVCISLCLLWPGLAAAQSAGTVLSDFGIIGRWASDDCKLSPSFQNMNVTYTVISPELVEQRNNVGPGTVDNVFVISEAKRLDDDRLWTKGRLNDRPNQEMIFALKDGKSRTMSNMNADGTYITKDGMILAADKPTPWTKHCD
jgi:hypothetical protein